MFLTILLLQYQIFRNKQSFPPPAPPAVHRESAHKQREERCKSRGERKQERESGREREERTPCWKEMMKDTKERHLGGFVSSVLQLLHCSIHAGHRAHDCWCSSPFLSLCVSICSVKKMTKHFSRGQTQRKREANSVHYRQGRARMGSHPESF